jgi:histidine ammonia-lyase
VAKGARVRLSSKTATVLGKRRREIVAFINSHPEPAYGFNRGFGHNVDQAVDPRDLNRLQKNIIRSHASGVGDFAPREVVRAAMVLRAHSLAQGQSGVRPQLVKTLVDFLNSGITPCVPSYGSVGASGDLAPLSHIGLALMGEGLVTRRKSARPIPAAQALKAAGIKKIDLEMKEGLALNNGVQFSTAFAILAHSEMENLLRVASLATAMAAQVMLGSDAPFASDVHALRPHSGAKKVAKWIWNLMQKSPMRECHRYFDIDGEIQDPYNLRCAAQVLGSCHELIEQTRATLEIEANSVTDNPLLFPDRNGRHTRIISAGHFHGMPVAIAIYNLIQAMGIMARLSNMRCVRYVDEKRNKGLSNDLVWPGLDDAAHAASSGMMVPEYASAALTNALWGAAMPSHLFSLSTDAGQEDHVSMSAGLAVRAHECLPRLAEVLAVELAFTTQALAIRKVSDTLPTKHRVTPAARQRAFIEEEALRKKLKRELGNAPFEPVIDVQLRCPWNKKDRSLSPSCEAAAKAISKIFPTVTEDRSLSEELRKLAEYVRTGELVELTRAAGY